MIRHWGGASKAQLRFFLLPRSLSGGIVNLNPPTAAEHDQLDPCLHRLRAALLVRINRAMGVDHNVVDGGDFRTFVFFDGLKRRASMGRVGRIVDWA